MASGNRIVWTESAKLTFAEILDFLQLTWRQKQVDDFYNLTDNTLENILRNPYQFPFYEDSTEVHRALVHKNVSLFYKIDSELIILMLFFDNRRKPIRFK